MSDKEETKKDEKDAAASDPESPAKAKPNNQGLCHYVVPTERCGSFNVYVQVSKIFPQVRDDSFL